MAPHSSTLAWKIPWMEEPGGLQSTGLLRVGHDWVTSLSFFTLMHWRRKWQPTAVFLPGESQGRGSLVHRLPSMGSHRVGHDWRNLAVAAAVQSRSQSIGFLESSLCIRPWKEPWEQDPGAAGERRGEFMVQKGGPSWTDLQRRLWDVSVLKINVRWDTDTSPGERGIFWTGMCSGPGQFIKKYLKTMKQPMFPGACFMIKGDIRSNAGELREWIENQNFDTGLDCKRI